MTKVAEAVKVAQNIAYDAGVWQVNGRGGGESGGSDWDDYAKDCSDFSGAQFKTGGKKQA